MTTKFEELEAMLAHMLTSKSPYVVEMNATVEDSPWHREANVLVHTKMVAERFLDSWHLAAIEQAEQCVLEEDRNMFCAGVAAIFHDFGKPDAEEEHTTPERGTYRRYKGHEAISGAAFREIANDPAQWAELFGDVPNDLTAKEKYVIALMIQHHLPYGYKDEMTSQVLRTMEHFSGGIEPFFALLRADSRGRISDDHETKLANVETWIANATVKYHEYISKFVSADVDKLAYVLVGPSGAGKGTYVNDVLHLQRDQSVYSMDDMRLALYGDEKEEDPLVRYTMAWQASIDNETDFKQLCTKRINELVKSKVDVVVSSDNMNLSKKARRQFVSAAKQAKRATIAVVFISVPLEEVVQRGKDREDRGLSYNRLRAMYHQMRVPAFDEVDYILVV